MLVSDPHAWLYPLFARLSGDRTFPLLAPFHQFELLRAAVALEQPSKAAELDEWSPAARYGLLLHLANTAEQSPPTDTIELWRVMKGDRELRCVTRYLPSGIDLGLLEGDDFRRTRLCRDAPAVESLSKEWLEALTAARWVSSEIPQASLPYMTTVESRYSKVGPHFAVFRYSPPLTWTKIL